ncbi:aminodeoxychorismate synthase component I [Chondrinema litorale]|uniref:aminodeoxychorismate synthase component I n=1 Tax=Chondrinema litorale TaxID=2994555 RepID=UPI00254415D1|nr:aminodeoxychorismate synthase component I [Chondrinema litorale]UZR93913.1 aminodeoxychorismate synthase component I [Chondrinema litorale]
MTLQQAVKKMNIWGQEKVPFFFMIDFYGKEAEVLPLSVINSANLLYNINGINNTEYLDKSFYKKPELNISPVDFDTYLQAFKHVKKNLLLGNSFLVNLTFPTKISTNLSLLEIFKMSKAKYKVWFKNQFVVFSPETFVRIEHGKIYSNPMKGTISAEIHNAEQVIINDQKEMAEHTTIVDLIRNDLSMVASNVKVDSFRYIDTLETNKGDILQVSSQISGNLPSDYPEKIGSIIGKLLPAGSISGAPKKKTLEIIKEAEIYDRGFYTGTCGIFDGQHLDSAVMIRFIEQTDNGLIFKSGGGITAFSNPQSEYEELIKKVYFPFS